MSHLLVNHNEDIRRLIEKGYAISFDNNHLVIRDIPYLDGEKNLQSGAMVLKVEFIDQERIKPINHQIFFCGSHPCQLNGTPIQNFGGGQASISLTSPDLIVQRSFSNKPANGFADFFEIVESYVTIISGPAINLHNANPLTFKVYESIDDPIFKYADTLTTRAEIGDITLRLKNDIVAIIGLGGTGSYLLDFMVKTPVKEIRGFDLDWYHVHNAYRSPGRITDDELGKTKSDVYQKRYENFRSGVNIYPKHILADSDTDLQGVTFAFVCVDKGVSRAAIFELLIRMKIPFIDVGMGLNRNKGVIDGMIRITYYPSEFAQDILSKRLAPFADEPDDMYRNNIQISELNAFNACLAIIRYKQIRGFYADGNSFYHMLTSINDFQLLGENNTD